MQNRFRVFAVAVAALALAIGSYLAYEKYSRRTHVVRMVKDAAVRMDTLLRAQSGDGAGIDFDAQTTALEAYATTLARMDTGSFTALADAADDYLVTAREIARRAGDMARSRAALGESLAALEAHIRADRGAASWPAEAARLKQALDKDLRDYRIAEETYRTLLDTLPASQARLAPLAPGFRPIDEARVKRAEASALAAYTAEENKVKRVTDLGAYAGRR